MVESICQVGRFMIATGAVKCMWRSLGVLCVRSTGGDEACAEFVAGLL